MPSTLFQKVWDRHIVVPESADTPAVLYIDLHLIHEVTTPQAFTLLREQGLKVRRPDLTLGTMDHSTPTRTEQVFGGQPFTIKSAQQQVEQFEINCRDFGVEMLNLRHADRGIVHSLVLNRARPSRARRLSAATATPARTGRSAPSPSASAPPKWAMCWPRNACCSGARKLSRSRSAALWPPASAPKT
jgi:hypothetical protein